MTAIATYSPTGNAYVDGVLTGVKWGVTTLTFSFPTDATFYGASYSEAASNFKAFTGVQQAAVRATLSMYAAVSNVGFTEVTESATSHATLRYAESDAPGTAWAYYPSTADAGGDAWFNNSKHYYDSPLKGTYAWLTVVHETGHALGLKHPQDPRGAFGAMPLDKDSLEYSVMSYKSYLGGPMTGYTNGSGNYPTTLMMYDIAAVQAMYGADYGTNAGASVYTWSATTGEMSINGVGQGAPVANKIFLTVWDGGGIDTYDFSNYATNLQVNLQPGTWTIASSAQLASLGSGRYAAGNIANALTYQGNTASLIENAIGGAGSDTLTGNAAANRLTGGAGNDRLDGGAGTDTAVYAGLRADYTWVQNADGSWTVTARNAAYLDGIDTLLGMEQLAFGDGTVTITTTTPATPLNQAPVAVDDAAAAKEDTAITIAVLANDWDPDGTPLAISGTPTALHGSVTVNADGTLRYAPYANYSGTDTISYAMTDGTLGDTAVVAVTVSAVNDAPVAVSDAYAVGRNQKLTISPSKGVLANDGDADGSALAAVLVATTTHGTLSLKASGAFVYSPTRGYVGTDSFSYKASDGALSSSVVTVTIKVGSAAAGSGPAGISAAAMVEDQIPAAAGDELLSFHALWSGDRSGADGDAGRHWHSHGANRHGSSDWAATAREPDGAGIESRPPTGEPAFGVLGLRPHFLDDLL